MKTKPCLFLILFLLSILSPLGSFAQTDKITASWTFKTVSEVTKAVVNCSESSESVYVRDDANDGVFMQVQAKGNVITATADMLLPKTGVVLKIPVNNAGDKISVKKNNGKQCSYSIGITIEDIERYPIDVTGNNASEVVYTADEWDAGVGYVEIKMLNDDNEFIKISVEMTKKTAYTYYDESAETFSFLYDENKYTHDPKFVANLNSQCCKVYDNDGYIEHIYDTPHWNLSGYKKVVLTDAFINYTKSDAGKLKSCEYWFYGCDLANIEGLQNLNTSDVEDMRYMFANCTCSDPTAASTAFKNFDTRNVLDMGYMFAESFSGCENIDLDLSSFVAPKVTNLLKMFLESNIRTVDLSNFGGASVVEMRRMFSKCYSLESIDLSNWKSADGVSALTEYMFACVDGESQLKTVKLGKLNLSDRCAWMFKDCKNLKSVDMSQVNANKIIDMEYFFENCESLEDVDVSGTFEFDGPISLQGVFKNCKSLECLDLRTWKTKNVGSFNNFFTSNYIGQACEKLNTVFVSDGWSTEGELEKGNIMLYDCVNLIGGNGFTYKSIPLTDEMPDAEKNLATGTTYAHPDEEDNPGLFTYALIGAELKYKIFYKLDGGKLPEGKTNPKEFAENDEVTLVNPEKEGYKFTGWTGTSATKLTEKSLNVSFKNSKGNRYYFANWQPRVVAEVDGNLSYPKDLALYCDGKETTITLPFAIKSGVVNGFILSFTDDKLPKMEGQITNNDKNIIIDVPESLTSGVYNGTLVFTSAIDAESVEIPITLTANIVQDAAVQLYTDVLIADNHEGIYNAFQWYKDGEPLAGATLQYYTEPKFDYTKSYSVELSGDGGKIMSCPVKWLSTAKVLNPSVKVYPNPAKQNELFTLEILDFDETQNYDIVIFTANGTLVKKISNVEKQTSVSLPAGIYSGSLISGDDKKGFKLIVK
ncbi:MAG: BspA family leucine-rich repeat surface protein [Bacteroidales bacterium]|nr:BspA family leucine-rich repeat surface protein [Bacteroidales bacterium]